MELPIVPIPSENKPIDKRLLQMDYKTLPKLPTNCCILGRVGSGKSSCLYSMLSKGYVTGKKKKKSVFDEIVCYIGNRESDWAFESLPCKNILVLHEFNVDAFDRYVEDLRSYQLKRLEKNKPPMNVALIFDDMATAELLKKKNGKSPLASLMLTSRHELNASVFFLSQIYKSAGFSIPMIRNNVTTWIIYNMSQPEWNKIVEDHCNDFDPKELTVHYDAMMATPHNFMVIDYRRPLDKRITERFTKILRPLQNASSSEESSDSRSGSDVE